jgi:hypothetical protein
LELAAIGNGAILPFDKEFLIAAPPGGYKLVIENALNLITWLDGSWSRKRRWRRWRIIHMAWVWSKVLHVENGA